MKITLTPNDQAVAIQAYLLDNYNITTYIDEAGLKDMQIDIPPAWTLKEEPSKACQELKASNVEEDVKALEEDVDREAVLERAEELGISYRSDIKTTTLIQRIEDEEIRLAKAIEKDSIETSDDDDIKDVEETQEAPKEIPLNDDDDLLQELRPKKKSIFERG